MIVRQLQEFLDTQGIKYITISHSRSFTAQETAESAHIPKKELAKVVVIKIEGKVAMAVIPASCRVDIDLLKKVVGSDKIEFANEREFKDLFTACEPGAMPPFGNLYGMDVYVTEELMENKEIVFNAGTHRELIRMAYKDFERLVKPEIAKFCAEIT
ncbi:MAG: aminoacyl-tRNA deacylase [Candidatus Loosdrechtia sp.]|uniref:aminoacyl-tRNA deacylase n=1 Tax=Candidatus Loosdrechtia sp. TaxID=3101272 RepID=UPI003A5F6640|nr:MAG: YbaK/EbsC family protein [Candidatus Jettenia sp. AMX2]